eukprot:COSAG06_NODE_2124_length_7540_cov_3.145794_1_plen_56_part_10
MKPGPSQQQPCNRQSQAEVIILSFCHSVILDRVEGRMTAEITLMSRHEQTCRNVGL